MNDLESIKLLTRLGSAFARSVESGMAGRPEGEQVLDVVLGASAIVIIAAAMRHPEWGQALARIASAASSADMLEAAIDNLVRIVPVEILTERSE